MKKRGGELEVCDVVRYSGHHLVVLAIKFDHPWAKVTFLHRGGQVRATDIITDILFEVAE
jgi:hypothetical protein